ncbi:hypothetical protein [Pedobacter sp. NJ-S-72]
MYGQELSIKLVDRDIFDPNDDLKLTNNKDILDKFVFIKEVNVIKALAFEVGKPGVSGTLLDPGQDVNSKVFKSTSFVQKCKFTVFIDPAWKSEAGSSLKIFPVIRSGATAKYFENFPRKFLTITENGKKHEDSSTKSNNPILVDEVETNVAAFHPCGYTVVTAKNNERDFEMYNQKSKVFEDRFEVVAGTIFTQEVSIALDEKSSTDDCRFKKDPNRYHKDHVFKIVSYPEKTIGKAGGHKAPSDFSITSNTKISVGGISKKEKHVIYMDDIELEFKEDPKDRKLTLLSRFVYNSEPLPGDLPYILRYFWTGKGGSTCEYVININSCRHECQTIRVITYPDIKWSLRLDYKNLKAENIKESKEIVSNQTYKDTKAAKFKREPTSWVTPDKQGRSFGLSLKAKFNNKPAGYQLKGDKTFSVAKNDGEEWDVTDEVTKKIEDAVKPINDILEFLDKTFSGKRNNAGGGDTPTEENKKALDQVKNNPRNKALMDLSKEFDSNKNKLLNNPVDSKEYRDAEKNNQLLQRKMDSRSSSLDLKLTRPVVGVELYWPEFGLEFDWSRVPVKNKGYEYKFNKTGVLLEGVLEAKPLIGIKAYLDFLALVQRAHPIALAIIAAADIAMALIGDGSKITLELSASMILSGKLQGFFNTETGENSFNSEDRDANSKALSEIGGEIVIKVTASVKMALTKRALFIIVKAELEVGVEAEAKFNAKTGIDYDDHGIFIAPELSFDGIQLKGKANIKGSVNVKKNDWLKVDSKNEFVYQAIDRQKPEKIGKIYIKAFE